MRDMRPPPRLVNYFFRQVKPASTRQAERVPATRFSGMPSAITASGWWP